MAVSSYQILILKSDYLKAKRTNDALIVFTKSGQTFVCEKYGGVKEEDDFYTLTLKSTPRGIDE